MKIAIVNGPNLNLVGERETEIYGEQTFESFIARLDQEFGGLEFIYLQSNVEGELINFLHELNKQSGCKRNFIECWRIHSYICSLR